MPTIRYANAKLRTRNWLVMPMPLRYKRISLIERNRNQRQHRASTKYFSIHARAALILSLCYWWAEVSSRYFQQIHHILGLSVSANQSNAIAARKLLP